MGDVYDSEIPDSIKINIPPLVVSPSIAMMPPSEPIVHPIGDKIDWGTLSNAPMPTINFAAPQPVWGKQGEWTLWQTPTVPVKQHVWLATYRLANTTAMIHKAYVIASTLAEATQKLKLNGIEDCDSIQRVNDGSADRVLL